MSNNKIDIVLKLSNEAVKVAQQYAHKNGVGFDTAVSALIVDGQHHIDVVKKHANQIIKLSNNGSLEPPSCCLYCDRFTPAFHQEHDEDCIVLLADRYIATHEDDNL